MFAHSTDLLQRTARVLGKTEDAAKYGALLERIKAAFQREFVTANGPRGREHADGVRAWRCSSTCCRRRCARRRPAGWRSDVRQRKHLTTGFVGTPYLCHVLSRYGYLDEAYLLLNRRGVPVVALPGQAGRHDDLGALGRPEAGRHVPGQGHELLQPLRLRCDRRVDVPRHGRHRDRPGGPRLQAHADPASARRRVHQRQRLPHDASTAA